MNSIRQYLFVRLVWGSIAILTTSSIFLGLLLRHLDVKEFDEILEVKARTLATLGLRKEGIITVDFVAEYMREFQSSEDTEYFQFRLEDGVTIKRSPMLGELDLPFQPISGEAPIFGNLQLPDNRRGRFVQIVFYPREKKVVEAVEPVNDSVFPDATLRQGAVVLTLARGRGALDALLFKVYWILAGTTVLLSGLFALSVQTALHKSFRPLENLNKQIDNLRRHGLKRQIYLPDAPQEIAVLPVTLNSLLNELQDSFTRERRFVSDVAHELRTPVAEFRIACEVGAKWPDDPDMVRRRFDNLQHSAVNMEQLLNGLLELSRLDSGMMEVDKTILAVAPLINSCWERAINIEPDKKMLLENLVCPDLFINTDKAKIEMLLLNLLINAVCYSRQGNVVTAADRMLDNGLRELLIRNHAHDLGSEDLPHIFDRFWRKDAARTGGRHSGLGLSIVRAIANVIGIQISAELSSDNIFIVRLLLPD